MLASLVVAAIAAAAVFVTTATVVYIQKQEAIEANKLIAELQKQTALASLKAEQIKAAVSWRELHSTQYAELIRSLAQAPSSATIYYVSGDTESWRFAAQLLSAFLNARWKARMEARPFTAAGVWVSRNAATPEQAQAAAQSVETVKKAFHKSDLEFFENNVPSTSRVGDTVGPNSPPVKIVVGSKPLPELR